MRSSSGQTLFTVQLLSSQSAAQLALPRMRLQSVTGFRPMNRPNSLASNEIDLMLRLLPCPFTVSRPTAHHLLLPLLRLALLASTLLWLAGHFLSARLTFDNTATLRAFSIQVGSGLALGRSPSTRQFRSNRGIESTLTLCDRHASILYHAAFPSPLDPTRIPIPYVEAPFWLLIPSLAAAVFLLRLYQRRLARRTNLCASCSYPLGDLPPSSPCPECGRHR